MVCKLVPIFAFILAMVVMFDPAVFTADFWGNLANNLSDPALAPGSVPTQIVNCFMVMMWVFVGMEGASVLGHRARRKSDVSRATILGCTALVVIYVAASILPYGYLTREELMALGSPSMPYIFERVVGPWGGAFISGGLIISIFGAWLSYTILASEAMHGMARMKLLPSAFDRLNTYSAPTACLFTTGAMIQLLSIVMLFSERAYQFAYSLCTASIAISWTLAAAYMAKAWLAQERRQGASEAPRIRAVDGICAACSAAFLIVAIAVSGVEQLMMCCIAYIPGIACYIWARVEQRQKVFTARERLLAFLLVAIGIFMIGYVAANGIL